MTALERQKRLQAISRQCRQDRKSSQDCTVCQTEYHGTLLELSVPSYQCRHDAVGHCFMCNYGVGESVTDLQEFSRQLQELLQAAQPERLLVSTNGSILDTHTLPEAARQVLLAAIADTTAHTVILETHPETVTEQVLQEITQALPNKHIILEIGLESAQEWVRVNCLGKPLTEKVVYHTLRSAAAFGMDVQCNVLLGTPFLSLSEQIWDAEQTIRWCLAQGCQTAVFPMQVRAYTLLERVWQQGIYQPPPRWALVQLLCRFTPGELYKIDIAQYHTLDAAEPHPMECSYCRPALQRLLTHYAVAGTGRWNVLQNFLDYETTHCECWDKFINHIDAVSRIDTEGAIARQLAFLNMT